MERAQAKILREDLTRKMVLLAGPRQAGKTWLSLKLSPDYVYLNWDDEDDRRLLQERAWSRNTELVVFDELHKKPKWKSWLKGIVDKEQNSPALLVTGSARLDIYRKGSDSLAGRYFLHRLYPFSIAELCRSGLKPEEVTKTMLLTGGFPEPFLLGSELEAKRWRRTHLERIITEDLLHLEQVRDLSSIELLVDFLSRNVGNPVSYASLARDLSVSPHTVKKWIAILESLYVIFVVRPYSKRLQRALSKEPKIYFFDTGRIPKENPGARIENLTALCLLKRLHYLEDTRGEKNTLAYIRDREKREVDFLSIRDGKEEFLIEVKSSKADLSQSLRYFAARIPHQGAFQLVLDLKQERQYSEIQIRDLATWLATLEI